MAFFRTRAQSTTPPTWNSVPQPQTYNKPTIATLGGATPSVPPSMPQVPPQGGNLQAGGPGWAELNAPYIGQPGTVMGQPTPSPTAPPSIPTPNATAQPVQRMFGNNVLPNFLLLRLMQNMPQFAHIFRQPGMLSQYFAGNYNG